MDQKLTVPEITYMRSLAAFKTDEELAKMMNKPVELIKLQFSIMAGLPKRPEEKPAAIAKLLASKSDVAADVNVPVKKERNRPGPKPKKPAKKKKAKKLHSAHAQAEERKNARKGRNNQSSYETKPINLNGKVPVKLNAKTTVWAMPGYDIDELKKKYKIV
jgi:hypothetical protein